MKRSKFFNFTRAEMQVFERLNTPQKIQHFLDKLPINFEENGETYLSPREMLRHKTAHCSEAAIFAAVALWYHGQKPLILDLKTWKDQDHVITLFRQNGFWGAISKTNHAALRYRDPIYKTVRELVLSFFHEYFKDNGTKTLRSYSLPYDLSKIKNRDWLISKEHLWDIIYDLDHSKHFSLLNKTQIRNLRKADKIEIAAGKITEWQKSKHKKAL